MGNTFSQAVAAGEAATKAASAAGQNAESQVWAFWKKGGEDEGFGENLGGKS